MIIFTVTSNITAQVFVGSTRNDLESQWEKMVAAAQQDLDYPLYREIRIHGEDAFTVEEWDRAEERQELLELEQEAIDHFGAKSLRGYKTSTVKILPKKKTRQRKSSIEKELASIFSSESSDTETPPSLAIKSKAIKSSDASATTAKAETHSHTTKTVSKPASASEEPTFTKETIRAALAKIAAEEKAKKAAAAAEKAAAIQTTAGSQANAMVQMKSINLSDDISAQLAAITAAADAVLSGDSKAAQELQAIQEAATSCVEAPEEIVDETSAIEEAPAVQDSIAIEKPEEIIKPVCPKVLRMRDAMERHREMRAQKSQEVLDAERKRIAEMLADLTARAQSIHINSLAAVA